VLSQLPKLQDPRVLVGPETSDDAGVFLVNEQQALVQTVDFFAPVVDDPYLYGQIDAANSLSDVYAMGGTPVTALNIACFPTCLSVEEMGAIIRGGADKLAEAGVFLLGGHTVENPEPRFGMSVTGLIDPRAIWRNVGARAGDALILTKPLGTGILATAYKGGMLSADVESAMVASMVSLNREAARVLQEKTMVHACTDVTGFGLLGHLLEMVNAGGVGVRLATDRLPILPEVLSLAGMGLVPMGAYRNREFVGKAVSFAPEVSLAMQDLLFDPQTSGGLLAAIPAADAERVIISLRDAGLSASCIGEVIDTDERLFVSR
jgi:selenide,water dikinase